MAGMSIWSFIAAGVTMIYLSSRSGMQLQRMSWAWRKTAWEVALCAEGPGFDSCPPHGAFLWGNGIVIVRLAEWPAPLWGLSEG
jgi:hypothetical protein